MCWGGDGRGGGEGGYSLSNVAGVSLLSVQGHCQLEPWHTHCCPCTYTSSYMYLTVCTKLPTTYTHTHAHTHTYTCTHTHIHTHMHTHIQTHTHIHIHTLTHTHTDVSSPEEVPASLRLPPPKQTVPPAASQCRVSHYATASQSDRNPQLCLAVGQPMGGGQEGGHSNAAGACRRAEPKVHV